MRTGVAALLIGVLFGLGLAVSGMTNPDKVIGFLDVAGAWDATLAFVMGGAILVGVFAFASADRCGVWPDGGPQLGLALGRVPGAPRRPLDRDRPLRRHRVHIPRRAGIPEHRPRDHHAHPRDPQCSERGRRPHQLPEGSLSVPRRSQD